MISTSHIQHDAAGHLFVNPAAAVIEARRNGVAPLTAAEVAAQMGAGS